MRTSLPLALLLACQPRNTTTEPVAPRDPPAEDTESTAAEPADGASTESPAAATPVTLTLSGATPCADPARRTEIGAYAHSARSFPQPSMAYFEGGSAVGADLDDDGATDLVLVTQTEVWVLWNDGDLLNGAPQIVATAAFAGDRTGFSSALPADLDGDGDLDLHLVGRQSPDFALRNDGGRAFNDQTAAWGLADLDPEHHGLSSSMSDIDGDGDLDLFVAAYGYTPEEEPPDTGHWYPDISRLLLNDGHGQFSDITDRLPAGIHDGFTFSGGWLDGDGDGDDDLYTVNDFGGEDFEPNRLYLNDDGWFREDPNGIGLDIGILGMGLAIGDLDQDGDEDVFAAAWGHNVAMYQSGGLWFETADAKGFTLTGRQEVGWGAEIFDADNDGLADVHVPFGNLTTRFGDPEPREPDALYLQRADGRFVDVAARHGLDSDAPDRVGLPIDVNGDGWLDLAKPGLDGELLLHTARCGTGAWLTFDLRDSTTANTRAVGATVRVFAGDRQWIRRVRAGGTGMGAGAGPRLHVGLGELDAVDRVEITWPDGETWSSGPVATRQHARVER